MKNGFPKEVDLATIANRDEYDPQMLSTNLMFGTPDEVIAKLKPYETLGVDRVHLLRQPRPRHEGAEALAGAVLQGSHPRLRTRRRTGEEARLTRADLGVCDTVPMGGWRGLAPP